MELRNRAVERAESAGEISSAETAPTARGAPRKTREPPPTIRSTTTGGYAQPAGEISSAGTGRRLAVGSCQGRVPTVIAELEILQ